MRALLSVARWRGNRPDAVPKRSGVPYARDGDGGPAVVIGARRLRGDSVVHAIGWPPDRDDGRPDADFDLEIAPLDDHSTHLQLSGQIRFPWMVRWSDEERTAERHCMRALSALLGLIVERLAPSGAARST
jgi:hypothetical protein